MNRVARGFLAWGFLVFLAGVQSCPGQPTTVPAAGDFTFAQSARRLSCYEFVEVTIRPDRPPRGNPFTDVSVTGRFGGAGLKPLAVEGFCDSDDGSVYKIRFMPTKPGDYQYSVAYRQGELRKTSTDFFKAVDDKHRGILRADPDHPWHFLWEGTGEHYFLNGTTAFLLMGWDDEKVIRDSIDRLHGLEVNRIRLLLDGRSDHFWTEPIQPGHGFRAVLNPWPSKKPDDPVDPQFDYRRFNPTYWRKFERMLQYAQSKDMIVSIVMGWNDDHAHPAADGEDERRYFRYAVARLGGFSNITWDLGDDLDSFRDEAWTHAMGTQLEDWDVYHHLATSHPVNNDHQDRAAAWFGMTSFQQWSRPLHQWLLDQRRRQAKTGRIIPQVDEEYGYEDHYPSWAPYQPPAASADANRRTAWEISMAGCYQTTGETAKHGTGVPPDTGGGWVNGRGDDTMVMLKGYAHMVDFFTSFSWWKADPSDDLVNNGAMCLAESGAVYAIYLPHGGTVTANLEPGRYDAKWFNPRSGRYTALPPAAGLKWISPAAPDKEDWAPSASPDRRFGEMNGGEFNSIRFLSGRQSARIIIGFSEDRFVAQADIIIADEKLLPRAVELYNSIFRPKREVDFFKRRFLARYNTLTLLARMDDKPVGFWIGFELKPGMFYHWLGAVTPEVRRHGIGRQLQEAQQAWAKDHGYEYIRCECMNHQREFIHFAVTLGYDIVGIRWDSTHADNLVVFEKNLLE